MLEPSDTMVVKFQHKIPNCKCRYAFKLSECHI